MKVTEPTIVRSERVDCTSIYLDMRFLSASDLAF